MKRIIIETSISIENNEVYNIVANNVKLYKSNDYSLLKCFEGNRVGCLEQLEREISLQSVTQFLMLCV